MIHTFIDDLMTTFLKSFNASDKLSAVEKYQSYYLGSVIFNASDEKKSILDGQQRIISIILFLIYLNNLQKNTNEKIPIQHLIISEKNGDKSFAIINKNIEKCLKDLFEKGKYKIKKGDDKSVKNMVKSYDDISNLFPKKLTDEALPYFIKWLTENVLIAEIILQSDENNYMTFKTTNTRRINLSRAEILKGYILSQITNSNQRLEINNIWKEQMQQLNNNFNDFFNCWFLGKYAIIMKKGLSSDTKVLNIICSRFHNWFQYNHKELLQLETSDEFYNFFKNEFPFFVKCYLKIEEAKDDFNNKYPNLNDINYEGLTHPFFKDSFFLAPINYGDNDDTLNKKLDNVANFINTFEKMDGLHHKIYDNISTEDALFNIVKLVRNNNLTDLNKNLANQINSIKE